MELIDGYDHQPGVHCGATAIRNVTRHYGWQYTEATSFGIGGGPAFVQYADPGTDWGPIRASPVWLERAFFERTGIPHLYRSGDDFAMAWENVAARVEDDDPVLVFLDPESLPYLSADAAHVPPHVAVVVGYEDEMVFVSDAAVDDRQELSRETLATAWSHDRYLSMENEYLVVTRSAKTEEGTDAAAAGLRQAATYMLDPLHVKRNARGPGEEGLAALRDFADSLGLWSGLEDPEPPVRAAKRAIDEHGDGTAFRALFAESLAELGRRTGVPIDLSERMERVAREWGTVADRLDDILDEDGQRAATFEEAASVVGGIADREEAIFEELAAELGQVEDQQA
ncbi:Peptidase family C39 [Halanaeroarchaeum sp. HSR-CO]|uniref:BtrH N-terminal domain-containing protein n=1 Tax=Halanaeroarchaeum sp. HSR-CO TaxID=2866382 RepID=UPI00217D0426|nr:BtrH N-terminal domain-containing protein [Halanaeroarchaeum sp. HSR-CO]UWG48617.1 Peptidase family C39 [Halanaeroarchaeum sp. HSR-CO]